MHHLNHALTLHLPRETEYRSANLIALSTDHGMCILLTTNGLYRLDLETYQPLWAHTLSHKPTYETIRPSFLHLEDTLIVKTTHNAEREQVYLYAIDAHSGAIRWHQTVPSKARPALFDGQHIFYRDRSNKQFIVLDPQTGATVKTTPFQKEHVIARCLTVNTVPYMYSVGGHSLAISQLTLLQYPDQLKALLPEHRLKKIAVDGPHLYTYSSHRTSYSRHFSIFDGLTGQRLHQLSVDRSTAWLGRFTMRTGISFGRLLIETTLKNDEKQLFCFDIVQNRIVWSFTFSNFQGIKILNGTIMCRAKIDDTYQFGIIDSETGAIAWRPRPENVSSLNKLGRMLHGGTYRRGDLLFSLDETPATTPPIVVDLSAEPLACPQFNLLDVLNEPPHPLDLKEQTLTRAVAATRVSRDFASLYEAMREVFEVSSIHPATKQYIEATFDQKTVVEAAWLTGFSQSHTFINSYRHFLMDDAAPKDKFLPALAIATSLYGAAFYLFIESGIVVGAHHDVFWNEYFDEIWEASGKDAKQALEQFISTYGVITYTQFAHFLKICRERYGVTGPEEVGSKMRREGLLDAIRESCAPHDPAELAQSSTFEDFFIWHDD